MKSPMSARSLGSSQEMDRISIESVEMVGSYTPTRVVGNKTSTARE
jgi:hypothetical protein